jgi:hypothetical protein
MAIKFVTEPESWAALADFAADLGHADWREEVLSTLDTYGPGAFGPPVTAAEPHVTALRPAV